MLQTPVTLTRRRGTVLGRPTGSWIWRPLRKLVIGRGYDANLAREHHYIPEFHLKRWASKGPNGKLREFSRPYKGKLYSRWRPPSGTGFERDLYTVELGDYTTPVALETQFFSRLDNAASKAIDGLVTGRGLDEDESSSLTQFIFSLLLRDPETIAVMRNMTAGSFNRTIEQLQGLYSVRRHEVGGPELLRDFMGDRYGDFANMTFLLCATRCRRATYLAAS